jgi:uncharacterized protein YlxP (DUF503 family)
MVIGLLTCTLSIPEARSLKDKRSVLRRSKDRIANEVNAAVAEVGRQDSWNYAEMAFVTVAAEKDTVDGRLARIVEMLRSNPRHVLLDVHTELL